jgi:hypothetical protein
MPTAFAPSASALNMSVPRRTPPSANTGMRSPTSATTYRSASIVARPVSLDRPTIRLGDAVEVVRYWSCWWWAHLVGALAVHPHKYDANFPPQKDGGIVLEQFIRS